MNGNSTAFIDKTLLNDAGLLNTFADFGVVFCAIALMYSSVNATSGHTTLSNPFVVFITELSPGYFITYNSEPSFWASFKKYCGQG